MVSGCSDSTGSISSPMRANPTGVEQEFCHDVTVVITAHDSQSTLSRALSSVLEQGGFAGEILVVDDASAIPIHLPAVDAKNIRLIRLIRNVGVVGARNLALSLVNTEFVLFLDGDDELLPGSLGALRDAIGSGGFYAFAFGHTVMVFADGGARRLRSYPPEGEQLVALYAHNFVSISALMRREPVAALGGFDPMFNRLGLEDWDLWLSILDKRLSAIHVDRDVLRYHVSETSRNNRFGLGSIKRLISRGLILFKHRTRVPLWAVLKVCFKVTWMRLCQRRWGSPHAE